VMTPLLVLRDGTIISGHRRWKAAKQLGLAYVPTTVSDLTDPLEIEQAVIESNRQREKTFSQKMNEARELERIERKRAIQRQATSTGGADPQLVQNFAQADSGKTRDKVAGQVGIGSGEQLRKAKKVWDAAQSGDEEAQKQVDLLDAEQTTIHAAYQRVVQKQEREQTQENVLLPVEADGNYRTIVIDPPWPVQKITREVRPNQDILDYRTMTVDEIAKLPVADLANAEGCHVYLWVTQKHLPDGLKLFEQWGVKYQCVLTWVKPTGVTPFSWMYNTELVLFGRIGSLKLERFGLKLSIEAPVTKHSEKPEAFYERVLQASPGPRLDMFARRERDGFKVWGDEV